MKRHIYPIAQDGWLYLVVLAAITVGVFLIYPYVAVVPALLFLFVAFFFRNPRRKKPQDKDVIVSPADGVILSIDEVEENDYLKGTALRISIFLSVFNVHINRFPVAGSVEYYSYRPGKFLPAFKSHASDINEKNFIGINTGNRKVMVTQVTGFIARRIVCWVDVGDQLERGERFGLIKFGSCTELFLPLDTNLTVGKGDKVRGGETIVGRLPQ